MKKKIRRKKFNVKNAFTEKEIKIILDTNYKSSKLIEKLFKNKAKFEDKVIKKIKEQEIAIKIIIFVNTVTILYIFLNK